MDWGSTWTSAGWTRANSKLKIRSRIKPAAQSKRSEWARGSQWGGPWWLLGNQLLLAFMGGVWFLGILGWPLEVKETKSCGHQQHSHSSEQRLQILLHVPQSITIRSLPKCASCIMHSPSWGTEPSWWFPELMHLPKSQAALPSYGDFQLTLSPRVLSSTISTEYQHPGGKRGKLTPVLQIFFKHFSVNVW